MQQRDFFKADVLAYPLAQTIEVERMARFLHIVHGERAESYYTSRCKELAKQMREAGLTPEEVQRQIFDFQKAVQVRLQAFSQQRAGSGA